MVKKAAPKKMKPSIKAVPIKAKPKRNPHKRRYFA